MIKRTNLIAMSLTSIDVSRMMKLWKAKNKTKLPITTMCNSLTPKIHYQISLTVQSTLQWYRCLIRLTIVMMTPWRQHTSIQWMS